jgi:flagellar basal-body rod protein FlgG
MLRSLYTAATGMEAQTTKMDVVANNLANASTTGFKKVQANFEDLLSQTLHTPAAAESGVNVAEPSGIQVGLGTRLQSTTPNLTEGDMTNTNNTFDLAIQGNGYFKVQQVDGTFAYTRAGNFSANASGQLVTQNGLQVEPGISIPTQTTQVTITPQGQVLATVAGRTEPTQVGQIELATFTNPAGLLAQGNNLLVESAASGSPITVKPGEQGTGQLAQGFLEGSNVQAVNEMIDMIAAQRAYEMNSQVITATDNMLGRLANMQLSG